MDKEHTQVVWKVNHRGVTPLYGAIGASGGTLVLDPANPSAAKVTVTFSIAEIATTSAGFTKHLMSADFFEVEKNPTASFTSTSVEASGTKSKIAGDLTIKGVTKPIVLDAEFFGAGTNPRSKKLEVGFTATAKFKRSDFGLGFAAPAVSDNVDLEIVDAAGLNSYGASIDGMVQRTTLNVDRILRGAPISGPVDSCRPRLAVVAGQWSLSLRSKKQ